MSTEDRPQVPISRLQFFREAWWAGSLLAMLQYKVASVLLLIGTSCGIVYWWYCDQQWSLGYGWAAGLATVVAGGLIISDWWKDALRILRETRGQDEDVHAVSASIAGIFVVFTVSVVTLIWGPWLHEIGPTLVLVVVALGLTAYLGRELNHSRQCPGIRTRLYGAWLASAAVLMANCLLGASLPRWIVASVAELSLAWLILHSVPSGILRAVWEHRWKEQMRSVTNMLGPHEDYPVQPFWFISLWADVLKVAFLLVVLFFAEDGHRMVAGFWPACCAVIASWVYLNHVVTWVIGRLGPTPQPAEAALRPRPRGLDRTMPGPVGPYQDYPGDVHDLALRMDEQLKEVEPVLATLDTRMWTAICILALPFGLRLLPLFLFSAIPTFAQVLAASSRQMGGAGRDAGQDTEGQLVIAALARYVRQILALIGTPQDRQTQRWRSQIWGLLLCAFFVGLVHTLSVQWDEFAGWMSHRSSVLAMSPWRGHLQLAEGGIGYGLLSYAALLAVMLWRMMALYQNQATKLQALNDAVEGILHDLKTDADRLKRPLEKGQQVPASSYPAWLQFARSVHFTWALAKGRTCPLVFAPDGDGPDSTLLKRENVIDDIADIIVYGVTTDETDRYYERLWRTREWLAAKWNSGTGGVGVSDLSDLEALKGRVKQWVSESVVIWPASTSIYRAVFDKVDPGTRQRVAFGAVPSLHSTLREFVLNGLAATLRSHDLHEAELRVWVCSRGNRLDLRVGNTAAPDLAETARGQGSGRKAARRFAHITRALEFLDLDPTTDVPEPCARPGPGSLQKCTDADSLHWYVSGLSYELQEGRQ